MEQINLKIQELLDVSKEDLIGDKDFITKFDAKMKRQKELMDKLETLAKANKTILGRTLRFPCADSYALYLITSVNKTQVQLKWLNWCDAWVDDRCGYACRMSRSYAEQQIRGRDALDEMFSKNK